MLNILGPLFLQICWRWRNSRNERHAKILGFTVMMFIWLFVDIKCPVCHKSVPPDSVEIHLVMCLTKPHIVYNGKLNMMFVIEIEIHFLVCH